MNEHGFIRAVHAHLPPEIFRWKIHDTFAGGVPDAFYAGPASTLFVEYKYIKALPKRTSTNIKTCLTPQQVYWLNTLHTFGQPVALIVAIENQALVLLNNRWNANISKASFLNEAIPRNRVATWIQGVCTQGIKAEQSVRKATSTSCSREPSSDLGT